MSNFTAFILYPTPTDIDEFEERRNKELMPMLGDYLPDLQAIRIVHITSSPAGEAEFYLMVELMFANMKDLERNFALPGGQKIIDLSHEISTGGAPHVLMGRAESLIE